MTQQLTYIAISALFLLSTVVPTGNGIFFGSFFFCLTKNDPAQIRLALRPNGVTISWTTPGYIDSNDTPTPQVAYGTNPNNLNIISPSGFTTTYHPLPILKRFFHNVYLDGLQPSTKYYYRIQSTTRCVRESAVRSFTTAPSSNTNIPQAVNISIVGDLGLNNLFNENQAQNTIAAMQKYVSSSNLFLHIGDIAYADLYGLVVNFDLYESTWNKFQQAIEPITSAVPYQVLPGNHEATCFQYSDAICPVYLKNFNAYNHRFHMSGELSGGYKNMWYSFDYGPVHFIMLNTETDFAGAPSGPGTTLNAGHFRDTTAQVTWLENDLKEATKPERRAKVPWIVAAGHRQFFGSLEKAAIEIAGQPLIQPSGNCETCRAAFWPLLNQYKVDFYFCGHVHWMELLYPMNATGHVVAKDFNNVDGVIHVTDGAGAAPSGAESIDKVDTERQAWFFGGYGFHRLLVKNSSHVTLEFINSATKNVIKAINVIRYH